MIHFKQKDKARAVNVETSEVETKVRLDLVGGGRADLNIPGKHWHWHSALVQRLDVSVTLEVTVPERLDLFEKILSTEGPLAALNYARQELAK